MFIKVILILILYISLYFYALLELFISTCMHNFYKRMDVFSSENKRKLETII